MSEPQNTAPPVIEQPAPPAPPSSRRSSQAWVPWTAGGIVGLVLGVGATLGITALVSTGQQDGRLAAAFEECGGAHDGVELGDGGRTIVFDMKGDEDTTGAEYLRYECLAHALDMPSSVNSHVGQTTSLDGRQTESWDGISFSWSYHPDRGLDGVFELAR